MKTFVVSLLLAAALGAAAVSYTYDDAGRLVKADYGNGQVITYTYDNAGNLLSRTVAAPAATETTKAAKPAKKAPAKAKQDRKKE